jgi:hypothetical protein
MSDGGDDFSGPSVDPRPQPGRPPADWPHQTWLNYATFEWWYRGKEEGEWRLDPPPVQPLGLANGIYMFVTLAGEVRGFSSGQLFGRGGLPDLFTGDLRWPKRHYPARDREGNLINRPSAQPCMEDLISACKHQGYYDGSTPFRSVGTWRGPDGRPVVHAGDRVFHGGMIYPAGGAIGDARYVLGGKRKVPAHDRDAHGAYTWKPDASAWHKVLDHLDEWHWQSPEALELFFGGIFCDMYGDAPRWKPHIFVRAPAGSGKSTLLRYKRALLGGAAHPVQRTYSKAYLEQHYRHTSCALLLDEAESDTEGQRLRKVSELVLTLSDEGASGGRGSAGGQARLIDLHGTVTMVATLLDDQRGTWRTRVAYLELRALRDRPGHPPESPERMQAMIAKAEELSGPLRAYALESWDRFNENLKRIRAKILAMGGSPRDADQLGHLIAGWATGTSEKVIDDDELGRLERFAPFIVTATEAKDGEDDPGDLFNTLLGLPMPTYRGGDQLTVGMVIARARDDEGGAEFRHALLPVGLRLVRLEGEPWSRAWLAVATKHAGLERLFSDYPQYRGIRRSQILSELSRGDYQAKHSEVPLRFAGPQSRAWLVPPELLPSIDQESG